MSEVSDTQPSASKFADAMRHRLAWPVITLLLLLALNTAFNASFLHIEVRGGHLYGSLIDILNRAAPLMLVSLGMTLVIATRGIDISVGAVVAIAAAVDDARRAAKIISTASVLDMILKLPTTSVIAIAQWSLADAGETVNVTGVHGKQTQAQGLSLGADQCH